MILFVIIVSLFYPRDSDFDVLPLSLQRLDSKGHRGIIRW